MTNHVALLTGEQIDRLPERAREVVEYRKSGLSLNHIQGCPLDCAYCIRHTYGLWDQRVPRALMSGAEAVEELVNHRYFQPHVTPVQVFNRATDPFLPAGRSVICVVNSPRPSRVIRWRACMPPIGTTTLSTRYGRTARRAGWLSPIATCRPVW